MYKETNPPPTFTQILCFHVDRSTFSLYNPAHYLTDVVRAMEMKPNKR
jgi:hypothetical protein